MRFGDLSRVRRHAWMAAAVPARALVVAGVVVVGWGCHAACPPFWGGRALARREGSIVYLHLPSPSL